MRTTLILLAFMAFLTGCATWHHPPKGESYSLAIKILKNPNAHDVFKQIESCKDVVALRIIAFTARASAWPMEAGENIDFDNRLDDISIMALHQLFIINSEEANEAIEYYEHAFHPDGALSLFLKEWELERMSRTRIEPLM